MQDATPVQRRHARTHTAHEVKALRLAWRGAFVETLAQRDAIGCERHQQHRRLFTHAEETHDVGVAHAREQARLVRE